MEEFKYNMKYFYEEHKNAIIITLAILISAFLVWSVLKIENKEEEQFEEDDISITQKIDDYHEHSQELKKYFSIISINNSGFSETIPVLDINLYLKTPFEDEEVLREKLKQLVNLYKIQYNVDKKQFIAGINIGLYTRYLDYQEKLEPEFKYQWFYKELSKDDKKDIKEREKNNEIVDISEIQWENTRRLTKMPNYDEYSTSFNYEPYPIDVVALTDEEYAFFMKLKRYELLTGSIEEAVNLYVRWEYGVPIKNTSYALKTQFKEFMKRQYNLKGQEYNPYKVRAYQYDKKIAVENPALVLFNHTGYVAKDNIEAMQILVNLYPDKYRELFVTHLEENIDIDDVSEDEIKEYNSVSKKLEEILEKGEELQQSDIEIGTEDFGESNEENEKSNKESKLDEEVEEPTETE